jgi:hypothetical protein
MPSSVGGVPWWQPSVARCHRWGFRASEASHCLLTTRSGGVIVGTHYTGALLARDLGDDGPDRDRRCAFLLTHDRRTVLAAARSLLERLAPEGGHL